MYTLKTQNVVIVCTTIAVSFVALMVALVVYNTRALNTNAELAETNAIVATACAEAGSTWIEHTGDCVAK